MRGMSPQDKSGSTRFPLFPDMNRTKTWKFNGTPIFEFFSSLPLSPRKKNVEDCVRLTFSGLTPTRSRGGKQQKLKELAPRRTFLTLLWQFDIFWPDYWMDEPECSRNLSSGTNETWEVLSLVVQSFVYSLLLKLKRVLVTQHEDQCLHST